MASNIVAVRLEGNGKKHLARHVRAMQKTRSPNLSKWLKEAVSEKLAREKAQ